MPGAKSAQLRHRERTEQAKLVAKMSETLRTLREAQSSINEGLGGRYTPTAVDAVAAYCDIAARHGLDPAQMALAFCLSRPFMTSAIIGATSLEQLGTDIAAKDVRLSDEVIADIAAAHRQYPVPM